MNNPSPYYQPTGAYAPPPPRRVHWLPIVIAAIFVGIAVLFLLILAYPGAFGISAPTESPRFGFFGFFGFFFILIIAFFIVRVAFWGTRTSRYGGQGRYRSGGYGPNRPMMVARMRYARGEITREQYDQIMQDLGRRPGAP
jgi:uncharacterized membrane protein